MDASLRELLQLCVCLSRKACYDGDGVRTVIDGLLAHFPTLRIIDTNADLHAETRDKCETPHEAAPDHGDTQCEDDVLNYAIPASLERIEWRDVCVFVGEEGSIPIIIGIAYRGRAIAGVAHIHTVQNVAAETERADATSSSRLVYGVVGSSSGTIGLERCESAELAVTLALEEGESSEAVAAARDAVNLGNCSIATGNAIFTLLTRADIALLGSKRQRNLCALDALLTASGGRLTSLFGWPIRYATTSDIALSIVATTSRFQSYQPHDELCRNFRQLRPVLCEIKGMVVVDGDTPADIARSLTGKPFTVDELSVAVFGKKGVIGAYSVSESEAVRYKQSHACRIRFHDVKLPDDIPSSRNIQSTFCKRIVLRELPYALEKAAKTPFKLSRDIIANRNEATFLQSAAVREFRSVGEKPSIVEAFHLEAEVYDDDPLDSGFVLLLEDFCEENGWTQHAFLQERQLKAVLHALARMHAHFWLENPSPSTHELAQQLWKVGSYWNLGKQPEKQLDQCVAQWEHICGEYPEAWREDGRKLFSVARELDRHLHGASQTIIHGDPKSANFFFQDGSEDAGEYPRVGIIDFQWTGQGLCAVDVAYCIVTCISPLMIAGSQENSATPASHAHIVRPLLRFYYDCLRNTKASCDVETAGVGSSKNALFSFETFELQFKMAFLDVCRITVCDHWKCGRATLRERELLPEKKKLIFNAYNKSETVALWMMTLMHEYLNDEALLASISG